MSDIKELIRQEIERLENMDYPCDTSEQATGFYNALDCLSYFIDSLPEEKPSEDLEEAADNHIRQVVDAAGHPGWDWTTQDVVDAFIAGAKWQKAKDDEEIADLMFIAALDAGQRAREELVMKEAVEGEIGYWNQSGLSIRLDQSLEKLGYDMDTKVKIIIVKQ